MIELDYIKKYEEIAEKLGIDKNKDLEAAKMLESMIPPGQSVASDLSRLDRLIRNKNVFVFGAGPSLKDDLREIRKWKLDRSPNNVFIAADGAAKAFVEERITPNIVVTDLDGFNYVLTELNKKGVLTVVHGHGDNMDALKNVVPSLTGMLRHNLDFVATTQTPSFGRIHNFGGFTDGDRCVFMADYFKPLLIVLAGMDFGKTIGPYSGKFNPEKKLIKLEIGKKLLEEYAKESNSAIVNMTSQGEDLLNIPRISPENLKNLIDLSD